MTAVFCGCLGNRMNYSTRLLIFRPVTKRRKLVTDDDTDDDIDADADLGDVEDIAMKLLQGT